MSYRGPYLAESLVDRTNSPCRVDRIATVALDFDSALVAAEEGDVVKVLTNFLAEHGIHTPQQARAQVDVPAAPCAVLSHLAVPFKEGTALTDPLEVMRTAVLLGLSTSTRYDPTRPVVWTSASLTRRIVLLDTSRFYSMETRRVRTDEHTEPAAVGIGGFYALD